MTGFVVSLTLLGCGNGTSDDAATTSATDTVTNDEAVAAYGDASDTWDTNDTLDSTTNPSTSSTGTTSDATDSGSTSDATTETDTGTETGSTDFRVDGNRVRQHGLRQLDLGLSLSRVQPVPSPSWANFFVPNSC